MAQPALSIVPPPSPDKVPVRDPDEPAVIGIGDVFDEERQKELYRTGVEALATIAINGNDNAKMGAAAKLVDLFKKTATRGAKVRKIRIGWRDPRDFRDEEEDESINDLLA